MQNIEMSVHDNILKSRLICFKSRENLQAGSLLSLQPVKGISRFLTLNVKLVSMYTVH